MLVGRIDVKTAIETKITLEISEQQALALCALTEYGVNEFLECFYTHLGRDILKPHEPGIIQVFALLIELKTMLRKTAKLRQTLAEQSASALNKG